MDEDDDFPDFDNATFDFSQAHFLDHSVWHCRWQPGGRRRHLQYRWSFQWKSQVLRATSCRLGIHKTRKHYRRNRNSTYYACIYCFRPKEKL